MRNGKRESYYVHGTAAEEQSRLSRLNAIMNAACLREIRIRRGEKLLDIGSGLGQLTRLMARRTGVPAVGIERDSRQRSRSRQLAIEAGEGELVDFRAGDAMDLKLRNGEWGSFDLVHTRFVLEHVSRPLEVVRIMARAARTGGRVLLFDDDHDLLRLDPVPSGFFSLWRAYMKVYERNGNDPVVGRHLVRLLYSAGVKPKRNGWVFFGSCAGSPVFPLLVENLIGILEGARGPVLKVGYSARSFASVIEAIRSWGRLPDASIWYAISFAEGTKGCHPERSEGSSDRPAQIEPKIPRSARNDRNEI